MTNKDRSGRDRLLTLCPTSVFCLIRLCLKSVHKHAFTRDPGYAKLGARIDRHVQRSIHGVSMRTALTRRRIGHSGFFCALIADLERQLDQVGIDGEICGQV